MSMTPHRALRWSLRSLYATAPLAGGTFVAWLLQWEWLAARPILFVMLYQLVLIMAVAAGIVAILAGATIAVHEAFRAGYRSGATATGPDGRPPRLQVVE